MKNKLVYSYLFWLLLVVPVTYYSCVKEVAPLQRSVVSNCDSVKYSVDIMPIIQTECVSTGCHSAGGGSSGYDLSSYALLKLKVDDSTFTRRVLQGVGGWMPLGGQLPAIERDKIKCWVDKGAQNN